MIADGNDEGLLQRTLFEAAASFRAALDRIPQDLWRQVMAGSFPRGACGHCSEMLVRYFRLRFGIEPLYASGSVLHLGLGETHAWIEYSGLSIDITADQFGLAPVIVARESAFHRAIEGVERHPVIEDHWWGRYGAPVYAETLRLLGEADMPAK